MRDNVRGFAVPGRWRWSGWAEERVRLGGGDGVDLVWRWKVSSMWSSLISSSSSLMLSLSSPSIDWIRCNHAFRRWLAAFGVEVVVVVIEGAVQCHEVRSHSQKNGSLMGRGDPLSGTGDGSDGGISLGQVGAEGGRGWTTLWSARCVGEHP